MQGTEGLGQLSHVLETVLPIFGCDRVWLAHPCDTESRTWRMVAQHACPEFAGSTSPDLDLSMDAEIAEAIRLVAVSEVAVRFGAAASNSLPGALAERFGVQSQMCIAVRPKTGKPYTFGLDQCAGRALDKAGEELFKQQASVLRLLTNLLLSRDLLENRPGLRKHGGRTCGYWGGTLRECGRLVGRDLSHLYRLKPKNVNGLRNSPEWST